MPNANPYRNHGAAIAKLAAALWHWLERRNLAPNNPHGDPPELAIYGYSVTDDERADEAVSIFQEVAADFGNACSEFNGRYPELADDATQQVDLLELLFSMPVQRFLKTCRESENARRICASAGIQVEEIEKARYEVVLAIYALRRAVTHFLDLWSALAPDLKRRGISARSKDPVLSYFDWMLFVAGWKPDEIADVDGSYMDLRPDKPEHEKEDRTEAAKATAKRIDRMVELMSQQ
jgi:hypothetical protein